jgi:predicted ATP-grasp superfamily ATP-dependent carboligase
MAPRVLVSDGEERSALAACRALARSGYRVTAVAQTRCAGAIWSRSSSEAFVLPDPMRNRERFIAALERLLDRKPQDVVLPATDASLLAMSEHRERLERFARLGLPPHDAVESSLDKLRLLDAATAAGLAPPRSLVCDEHMDALAAANAIGFPLVVKPARTVAVRAGTLRQQPVAVVQDERTLATAVEGLARPFVLQEFVTGAERYSSGGVMTDGGLAALAVARFERTWPPPAGAVSFGETVASPVGLGRKLEVLLGQLGWRGIFELEYLELGGGRLAAIDLNPRPFGWLALAVEAGANLPAVWCATVLGRRTNPPQARPGVRYRWEEGDVAHFVWQLSRGQIRKAAAVARPHRHVVHAHFRAQDPGPLVARTLRLLGRARAG